VEPCCVLARRQKGPPLDPHAVVVVLSLVALLASFDRQCEVVDRVEGRAAPGAKRCGEAELERREAESTR
jgi:hypothetical protein